MKLNIPSTQLRNIKTIEDVVDWIVCFERNKIMKRWHRERYMPYNLPHNLTVELPWFYCMGNEASPWKRPMGK